MARRNAPLVLDQALNYIRNNASQETVCAGEPTTAYEGCDPNVWVASTAYSLGAAVRPTTRNNFAYEVTTAGTTAASEPTWPTTPGATVVNGTATFTCRANLVLAATAMVPGDYTLANGVSAGNTPRRLTMAAKSATAHRTATADHVGLMRPGTPTAAPELFWVTIITPTQAITSGNPVNIPAWGGEIGAAL